MFSKLLKYDFRSMLKQFALIWPAALALALVNRFTVKHFITSSTSAGETISGIAMLVYVAILIAMFVLAVIFIVQRFYKGLLGDEGYLMFTLPVRSWQLIGSKLICSVVVTSVSILVAIASILLIVPISGADLHAAWRELLAYIGTGDFIRSMLVLLLSFLLGMARGFLLLYLAMAVGHLFSKNRVLWSFVAYIGITIAVNLVEGQVSQILTPNLHIAASGLVVSEFDTLPTITPSTSELWISLAVSAAFSALYFALTNYILKHRLNLE